MQSWRRTARICKHILTARQRLDESLLGERRTDHTRTVGLAGARETGAQTGCAPVSLNLCARQQSFWKHRLRTVATLPDLMIRIMEAEASGLADQVLRVQKQAARRSWRAWLEENTTAGAAKVHQLIRAPIGFQAARGNAVDEQLKLRDAWAAVWQANTLEPALVLPEDDGPLFHRPSVDAMRRVLTSFRAVFGLGYDAVPPRALNELPDQGIEALIDLIMLIEEKCEWPTLCNRIVFIAKAAGGVRPIGLLFAIVRVQCKLRRIEAKMWKARNTEGLFSATQARGVERYVWEQATWSEWATADGHAEATILCDLLKAFDHVAYNKLIDAAVRTHFPVRQLKLPLQLYRATRHVELDGVAGEKLRAFRCVPLPQRSSSCCCWAAREVRAAHPFVLWSTTFPCSDLEAITWSRRSWNVQARAWPASS